MLQWCFTLWLFAVAFKGVGSLLIREVDHRRAFRSSLQPFGDDQYNVTIAPSATLKLMVNCDEHHFALVQAHSFRRSLTLAYDRHLVAGNHVNGTNLGLLLHRHSYDTHTLFLTNFHSEEVFAIVAAKQHWNDYPIPGGCSFLALQIASQNQYMTRLKVHRAGTELASFSCTENVSFSYQTYMLYLKDSDKENYFAGIREMMNISSLEEESVTNGTLVNYCYKYRGTGTVFATIATSNRGSSAYVPVVSYACDQVAAEDDCLVFDYGLGLGIRTVAFLLGCFMLFNKRYSSKFPRFTTAALLAGVVSFIALKAFQANDENSYLVAAGIACVFGLLTMTRDCLGFPLLIFFLVQWGIVLTLVPENFETLAGVISIGLLLGHWFLPTVVEKWGHALVCGLLISLPVSYYVGSSFHYILLNFARVFYVPHFQESLVAPPFSPSDLLAGWILLSTMAFYLNRKQKQELEPERTPILHNV